MRSVWVLCVLLLLAGCSYRITKNYQTTTVNILINNCQPQIVKFRNLYGLNISYLGSVKLDDSGFTVGCSEEKAINLLNQEACSLGANLINIKQEIYPQFSTSTCYRCIAEFYINYDDTLTNRIIKNLNRKLVKYDEISTIQWDDFDLALPDTSEIPYLFVSNIHLKSNRIDYWTGIDKDFHAQAVLYSDISGVKTSFRQDSNLIQMQCMFNLAQLYAKRLESYLNSYNFGDDSRVKVQEILQGYLYSLNTDLKLFNSETEYGRNKDAQERWIKKINEDLLLLNIEK